MNTIRGKTESFLVSCSSRQHIQELPCFKLKSAIFRNTYVFNKPPTLNNADGITKLNIPASTPAETYESMQQLNGYHAMGLTLVTVPTT